MGAAASSDGALPGGDFETKRDEWKQDAFGRHYFKRSGTRDVRAAGNEFQTSSSVAAVFDPYKNRVLAGCGQPCDDRTEYYLKFDLHSVLDGEGMAEHPRPPLDLVIVLVLNGMHSGLEACLLKTVGRLRSRDRMGVVVADGTAIHVLRPLDFIKPIEDIPQLAAAFERAPDEGVPDIGEAVHLAFSLLESCDAPDDDSADDEDGDITVVRERRCDGQVARRLGRMLLLMPEPPNQLSTDFDSRILSDADEILVWRASCDRAFSVIEAQADRCSSALLSTVVLLCPAQHTVPSISPERIHALPGCSCLVGHDATELSWRLVEELDYCVCPTAFSLTLEIESPGFKIDAVYGRSHLLPMLVHRDGQKVVVANTVFATPDSDDGCTRGRTCLFKLRYHASDTTDDELNDKLLEITMRYSDVNGQEERESIGLHLPNKLTTISALDRWDSLEWHETDFGECKQEEVDAVESGSYRSSCSADDGGTAEHGPASYYEDESIRKAVLIARYCDVMDAVATRRSQAMHGRGGSDTPLGSNSSTPEYRPISPPTDFLDAYTHPLDALLEGLFPEEEYYSEPDTSRDLMEFVRWFERERELVADKHASFNDEAAMLQQLIGQRSEAKGAIAIPTRRA